MASKLNKFWKKHPKRKELDLAIYNLGWKNCEAKYRRISESLQESEKSFESSFQKKLRHLGRQIRRLDNICPIDYILITIREAEKIIALLRHGKRSEYYASRLQSKLNKEFREIERVYQNFLEDIQEMEKEKFSFLTEDNKNSEE